MVPGQNGSSDKLKIAATKDQLKDAQNFARYEPPAPDRHNRFRHNGRWDEARRQPLTERPLIGDRRAKINMIAVRANAWTANLREPCF